MVHDSMIHKSRVRFHAGLAESILHLDEQGVPGNADRGSKPSVRIAVEMLEKMGMKAIAERTLGQTSGKQFEEACAVFVKETFTCLGHLRPGRWEIQRVGGRNRLEIANYEQYAHLIALDQAAKANPELAAALGNDYTITPDIVIGRETEEDSVINASEQIVDDRVALHASLRRSNNQRMLLHASISCKWTIRSDRSQNARSEGLNLIRNRKGRLPHVVVITGEPTPSRIASIALGTGDIDCVYHFALPELEAAVETLGMDDAREMLSIMVAGKRLKDIADLPLDLAI